VEKQGNNNSLLLIFLYGIGMLHALLVWSNLAAIPKDYHVLKEYPLEVQLLVYASTVVWLGRVVSVIAVLNWKR
jgi:hypothetical protein